MVRSVAMTLALAALPLAPAMAVVAIDTPPTPPVTEARAAAPPAREQASDFHLAPGELVAAIAGFAVLALTLTAGRQPHSVSA